MEVFGMHKTLILQPSGGSPSQRPGLGRGGPGVVGHQRGDIQFLVRQISFQLRGPS